MGAKNRVKLKIADCDISVASEDSAEYIRAIGNRVDDYIRSLMSSAPTMSTTMAAIFASLDFADAAEKEKKAADNLRSQIKEYSDEAARAHEELEKLRKSEHEAQQELKTLKTMSGLKALQEQRKTDE